MAVNQSKGVKQLSSKSRGQTVRRIWHSSIGVLICVLCYFNVSNMATFRFLLPITIVYGFIDWYRLRYEHLNARFCNFLPLRLILRREEKSKMTSSFYFLLGAETTLLVFSRPVTVLSLLYLSWCDPVAGIIGTHYGQRASWGKLWNGKSLIGSSAAAVMGMLITASFLLVAAFEGYQIKLLNAIIMSFLGGIIAAASELVTLENVDDNVTLPVISGILLTLFTPIESFYSHPI